MVYVRVIKEKTKKVHGKKTFKRYHRSRSSRAGDWALARFPRLLDSMLIQLSPLVCREESCDCDNPCSTSESWSDEREPEASPSSSLSS